MMYKAILIGLFMGFSAPAFAESTIEILDIYARVNGGVGKSGAVFFEIKNEGNAEDRLIDAKADVAKRIELHTHRAAGDGVMQMLHVPEGFVIDANGAHQLGRGGDHVMLMGLTKELADGDHFPLTLIFEKAGEVTVDVRVDNQK